MKPSSLNIVGLTYDVKWQAMDDIGGDKLGWCDFTSLTIYVADNQPRSAMCNTFLHEVIHAINYGMGITSGKEEQLTNRLANGLCAVWKDNPDAFKWWANLIKDPVKRVKRAKKRKRRT